MKFSVTQNKVELAETSIVNEGEYNATLCEFEFSEAYADLTKKAVFTRISTGGSFEVPILNDKCNIPVDVLKAKEYVTVGVYGYELDGDDLVLRYSPIPARFQIAPGSYREDVENPSDVTSSQAEVYESKIQESIDRLNDTVDTVQEKLDSGALKGEKGDQGDTGKQGERGERGERGLQGPPGKDFSIKKTYESTDAMEADASNVEEGEFVMITSTVEDADNAKLYVKNGDNGFNYITDLSGATGMKGEQGPEGIEGKKGEQGDPGRQGDPGADGFSPTISARQVDEVTVELTITNKDSEPQVMTFGGTYEIADEEEF